MVIICYPYLLTMLVLLKLCMKVSYNTFASDIWACGCVLVEICTGDTLWKDIATRDVIPTVGIISLLWTLQSTFQLLNIIIVT